MAFLDETGLAELWALIKKQDKVDKWKLLNEYKTAGAYTFTVPDDVDELGVLVLGGGGSGGFSRNYSSSGYVALATGGGSGEMVQSVLSKANGDFSTGAALAVVVGAGGEGVAYNVANQNSYTQNGNNGGSSSFGSIVAEGGNGGQKTTNSSYTSNAGGAGSSGGAGQASDYCHVSTQYAPEVFALPAPYGMISHIQNYSSGYIYSNIRKFSNVVNRFDPGDGHIYCGAGGAAYSSSSSAYCWAQTTEERDRGHAGAGVYCAFSNDATAAGDATAPGDGGGGMANSRSSTSNFITYRSGAGADGLVLVYGRKKA